MDSTVVFDSERAGDTLILTPRGSLDELTYHQSEGSMVEVLELLDTTPVKNVVLDLHRAGYFGSSAVGLLVRLWKRVRQRQGRLALCNVSERALEILSVTRLDQLWPVYSSREQALQAVQE